MVILKKCQEHEFEMLGSQVLECEVGMTPDLDRRTRVASLLALASSVFQLTQEAGGRAESLRRLGLTDIDAFHVASAELSGADVFLTTDDRLLKRCSEISALLRVKVANPVAWLTEVY